MTTTAPTWQPDTELAGFSTTTIDLGPDPDGETPIVATVIAPDTQPAAPRAIFVYLPGFTDYFFNVELSSRVVAADLAFVALDYRKIGRSRRPGQTPHHITDLRAYDTEIQLTADLARAKFGDLPLVLCGHSTGGLIVADFVQRHPDFAAGAVLDGPWLDLQGSAADRALTPVVQAIAKVIPRRVIPRKLTGVYGPSIHSSRRGEFDYNLDFKPLNGFPVTFGFISAVRSGHARVHKAAPIDTPILLLRSSLSGLHASDDATVDSTDVILDVEHMKKWGPRIGPQVTDSPLVGARHDAFLSVPEVRAKAYAALDEWLRAQPFSVAQ